MPAATFLIKPASSSCNMRCRYCFYFSEVEQRSVASYGMMSESTLETIVRKGLSYAEGSCGFIFQGGEPTLAGLPFFEKLIEFEGKYNIHHVKINNSIQTNGVLIDESWARFFHDNEFLVGLSLDGDSDLHNLNRIDAKGSGTFNRVMKTVRLFNHFKVEYNILTVITSNTSRHAGRIYDFYKRNGFRYLQFIPCLDPLNEPPGGHSYSLGADELERFLKNLFDRWYDDFRKGEYISIRYFDNLIRMLLGQAPEACSMAGTCSCNCVLEADGSMYPCDFYMLDEWRLGNIRDMEIEEMLQSERAKEFIEASHILAPECRECCFYRLCRGGCRRERDVSDNGELGANRFCSAYHGFFDYAYERLLQAAHAVKRTW